MAWRVEITETAGKQLSQLDRKAQADIYHYLEERIETNEDPRRYGDPLRKNLSGLWKYRVGNYRVVCDIQDEKVLVLVLRVGHRSKIYGGH